jgi:hypothetical protein
MTQDNFNNDAENAAAEASAEETLDALNGGNEMSFVATGETKKPINKTSVILFGIVAIGGIGLYLMHLRTGPQNAAAAPTDTANKTINQFLSGGQSNIKLMETMLRSTEKVVEQFNQYPRVKQVPLGSLQTNPFRVTGGNSEDADDATNKRKLAEQRQVVLKAFQTLQLQSIMYGEKNRSCLINNTFYREGQTVNGFVIEKITKDNVSVKQDEWRFDLKMAK